MSAVTSVIVIRPCSCCEITPVSVSTAVVEAGSAAASVVRADTPEGPRVWVMSTSAYR